MRLSHELRVGASQGFGAGAYGVRMNMLIPGDLPADDPRMADAGRAERLGSLSLYNDVLGALTWTEADNPMPAYAEKIKRLCSVQSRMRRCVVASNLSVRYLKATDSSKYEDGSSYQVADGNVMVQIPKFYYRIFADGDWIEMWVSPTAAPGYIVHPAFQKIVGGVLTEVNYRYVGAYEAVLLKAGVPVNRYDYTTGAVGDRVLTAINNYAAGDKLASVPGYLPCSSMNIGTYRTAARAIDGNTDDSTWRQMDACLYHAIQMLMVTEYAGWNIQRSLTGTDTMGMTNIASGNLLNMLSGNVSDDYYPIVPGGLTNSIGNGSGAINLQNAYPTTLPSVNLVGALPDAPAGWVKDGTKYTHTSGTDPIEFAFVPTPGAVYRVKLQYLATAGSISATFGGEALALAPGGYRVAYVTASSNGRLTITPTNDYAGTINFVTICTSTGTGTAPDDRIASYRGIENLYGHIWMWVDGVLLDFASAKSMTLKMANGAFNDTASGYTAMGVLTIPASGYVHKLQNSILASAFYPASTGGLASLAIGVSDFYFNGGAGVRVVAAGGFASDGGIAGAFCVTAAYGPSIAYPRIGGRLCL